ncbi:hypothetical protein VNO80_01398 [Phaseolus coccineus]|uniref:Uncharacterized protein n=1 Tax=Phaseolus coccineus TaxID=3886 RepID=A0AAN9WWK8_PHACN
MESSCCVFLGTINRYIERFLICLFNFTGFGRNSQCLSLSACLPIFVSLSNCGTTLLRDVNDHGFIWLSVQFLLVVLFAYIFYPLVGKHAVLSILLATFVGFDVVMSESSIVLEFSRWIRI